MEDKDVSAQGISELKKCKLDDPRQRRIHERLKLISPGLAKYFFDACKLRSDSMGLHTTSHLLAHLLREVESGIRAVNVYSGEENMLQTDVKSLIESANRILKNNPEKVRLKDSYFENVDELKNVLEKIKKGVEIDEKKRLTHRRQIEIMGESLKIPQQILDIWAELLKEDFFHSQAHRNNLEDPRNAKENEHLHEKVEVVFDAVLDAFEKSFDDIIGRIGKLLEAGPSQENASKLKTNFPQNYVCHNHFFSKNNDPSWLTFLRSKGFFKEPAAIEENKEEKTMRFVPWPQSEYLVRMANVDPSLIKDIVLEMNDTNNPTVLCDLVGIAINLPPDISIELLEKVKEWARNPYQNSSFLDEKLEDLTVYWARNNMSQQALELLEIVLQEHSKSETASNSWQFEQFIKKYYKELIEKLGIPALKITIEALDKIKNTGPYEEGSFMDGSFVWFPSIKNISLEERESVEGNLIAALKIGWDIIQGYPDKKREFIEALLKKDRALFYRIACHLMSINYEDIEDLASEGLKNFNALDDIEEYPEYGELLESFFEKLSPEDKKLIIDRIKSGPTDNKKYEEQLAKEYGVEEAKRSILSRTKNWQRNILVWIRDFLRKEELEEITDDPDGGQKYNNRSSIASFVGPTSPYTEEQIESMVLEQLIENLQKWDPAAETERDEFGFGPSKEGLGRTLTGVVKKDAQRFSENAAKFKGLSLEYIEGIFRGFREAVVAKENLIWEPILDLAKWTIENTPAREIPRKEDQDRIGVRMSICGLLIEALQGADPKIPIENKENVWSILEELTKDPNPAPERDENQPSKLDDYNTAINSIRGEALQGIVIYAFWVKEKQVGKDFSFKTIPEVQVVLEEHLSPSDTSRAIRAAYGRLFPFIATLDPDWAKENAANVFSGKLLPEEISSAAWKTYLLTHPSRKHTFVILRHQYEQALKNLRQRGNVELEDFENAFINHLMGLLWNDAIDVDDNLLVNLFAIPNDRITKSVIDGLGRLGLYREKNNKEVVNEALIKKLTKFYQERVKYIEENNSIFDSKTLEDYGWWFASGVIDKKISLELLIKTLSIAKGQIDPDHLVLEKLEELSDSYPELVSQCLDLIVQNTEEKWVIAGNKERIRKILTRLFKTNSANTIRISNGIVGRLAAKGYTEFSELKKTESDKQP